jgi:hypothetical protein
MDFSPRTDRMIFKFSKKNEIRKIWKTRIVLTYISINGTNGISRHRYSDINIC